MSIHASRGFYKEYPNRKDWRKPLRGAASADPWCRSNGPCPYCSRGRQHKNKRRLPFVDGEFIV